MQYGMSLLLINVDSFMCLVILATGKTILSNCRYLYQVSIYQTLDGLLLSFPFMLWLTVVVRKVVKVDLYPSARPPDSPLVRLRAYVYYKV